MPHTLAQEHMGIVDAIRYGTARTQATLAGAISGIGFSQAILVLTMAGDGVWTIGSNLTVPANITLWVPAGVTVNRAPGVTLTLNGQVVSWQPNWETGTGTTVRTTSTTVYTELTRLLAFQGVNVPRDGDCYVAGLPPATGLGRQVVIFANEGATRAGVRLLSGNQDANHQWDIAITPAGGLCIRRPGAAQDNLVMDTAALGLSNGVVANGPSHVLHLFVDDAFKPSTLWSVPSDARLKTVVGAFTDGLATICALPQSVRFTWNGQGGTLDDGKEYMGRLAQDVLPVAPYLIRTYQDKLHPADPEPTELYSANDSPLLEMLINAVKELAARVEALEGPALRRAAAEGEPEEERPARHGRRNG